MRGKFQEVQEVRCAGAGEWEELEGNKAPSSSRKSRVLVTVAECEEREGRSGNSGLPCRCCESQCSQG